MIKYNKKGINTVLHIWGKQTIISTKYYKGGDKTIFFSIFLDIFIISLLEQMTRITLINYHC